MQQCILGFIVTKFWKQLLEFGKYFTRSGEYSLEPKVIPAYTKKTKQTYMGINGVGQ